LRLSLNGIRIEIQPNLADDCPKNGVHESPKSTPDAPERRNKYQSQRSSSFKQKKQLIIHTMTTAFNDSHHPSITFFHPRVPFRAPTSRSTKEAIVQGFASYHGMAEDDVVREHRESSGNLKKT
jgi:hypothetical protein